MQTQASRPPGATPALPLAPRRIELDRIDALNNLLKRLGLWKKQRPDLAADIHQVSVCLLSHRFTDGRLDLTALQSNPALPCMPLQVWQSLRQCFASHDLQALSVTLPAKCQSGWSVRHRAAVLSALEPLCELNLSAAAVERASGKKSHRRVSAPA